MKNIKKFENLAEIKNIDEQKKIVDSNRPFSIELENKIFQKLKLDWNYNSNAIEGNQLSYGETVAFLNFGLTAKGKPFKDHLDIKGHNEAIEFMLQLIKENRPLSESDIKDLHKIILVEPYLSKALSSEGVEFQKEIKIGQYKTTPNHVKTVSGDIHYYTNPEDVAFEMNNLLEWYRNAEMEHIHPVIMSAIFHHKFTAIHPFDDGNGRLARILSNFILLRHGYPVIVIKNKEKVQYYSALNIADNGVYEDLIKLFVENISFSLDIMQKAINGENINEPDDLDKEIELFVKESKIDASTGMTPKDDKSILFNKYVINFLEYLFPKLKKIDELFQESYVRYSGRKFALTKYDLLIQEITHEKIPLKNTLLLNINFSDHLSNEFDLAFNLQIELKNKTIKYTVTRKYIIYNAFGDGEEEEMVIGSKIYSYNTDKNEIYNEVATQIISFIINFIKNKTKEV